MDSDFKNHRVEDPYKITSRQEQHIKKYVKDYFEKVVAQRKAHEKKKAERQAQKEAAQGASKASSAVSPPGALFPEEQNGTEHGMDISDDDGNETKPASASPNTPAQQSIDGDGLKRKRNDDDDGIETPIEDQATPTKRHKSETPPPPPPPPPGDESFGNQENDFDSSERPAIVDQERIVDEIDAATVGEQTPVDNDDLVIDHSLANISMGQSPDADSVSTGSGFRTRPDEEQEKGFDLNHFPSSRKLQVGSEE